MLRAIADVLLAAAQADGTACQRELRSLRRIMKRLTECDILPDWLEAHIANFRARDFQLEAAVAPLRELPREQRRHVVELVREVCDADIEYIRRFSLLFDMQIIWRTIFSAKARHNAY